ncbi:MAG: glycosyltransferase family 2 protein [Betaproteobacteria bacterium]
MERACALTQSPEVRISVVIPTYRRPALLARCLSAVLAQDYDPGAYEIIIVDDGCTDGTRNIVEALRPRNVWAPRITYLRPKDAHGPAVARNLGWRTARGELIAFTDDDTVPAPDWLARGEAGMKPGFAAMCGRVKVPVSQPPTDHELMTQGLESAEFVTANAFVRRDALELVGGFDERFTRAWREDSDLQFRLQRDVGPVGRCADAIVLHPVRHEPWGVCLRQQKNAFFDALLYKKHPRLYRERIHPRPPWDYYLIVGLVLAVPLLLAAMHPFAAGVAAGAALAMVMALAVRRLQRTAKTREHVLEMLATSAMIPFLSVYWRLRGAIHFRVLFL